MLTSIHASESTYGVFAVHALHESGAPMRFVFNCVDLAHAQALQAALREVCAFEVR